MNHEHEQSHAHATSADVARHHDTIAPGQSGRSALLRKPEHPVASGLVQRKPRDASGVVEGAEHAVATAASSGSSPLPSALMRQFERSLGVDLSGVRVHTGHASAEAADAVGAKAYTVGNDIHLGAGHYDPLSAAGQHLLAHEVAHIVQQLHGARGMQCKLEVSSPGDRFEHEADRAADAMISGGRATVSNAAGLAREVLQRQPADIDSDVGDVGASGWSGNLARAWASKYRETTRILEEWVSDEPNELKTTVATLLQSAMDVGALSVDVLKLGEGAAQGGSGWLDDLLRLASIFPELAELKPIAAEMRAMRYRPVGNLGKLIERNGLLRELRRFFYNNVTSKWARARYWLAGEGAQGRHLHHWLFPDRWKWVPNGIRQAGFNLMEVSRELNLSLIGPLIEVNEWIFRIGILFTGVANRWLHFTHAGKVVNEFRRDDRLGMIGQSDFCETGPLPSSGNGIMSWTSAAERNARSSADAASDHFTGAWRPGPVVDAACHSGPSGRAERSALLVASPGGDPNEVCSEEQRNLRPGRGGNVDMSTLVLCVVLQADRKGWPTTAVEAYLSRRWADARAQPGTRDTRRCRHVACCDFLRGLQGPGRDHVSSTGTDANRWS